MADFNLGDFIGSATGSIDKIAATYLDFMAKKYDVGIRDRQTTIEELKASTTLLQQQNDARRIAMLEDRANGGFANSFDMKKITPWLLLAGAGFFAYKLIK